MCNRNYAFIAETLVYFLHKNKYLVHSTSLYSGNLFLALPYFSIIHAGNSNYFGCVSINAAKSSELWKDSEIMSRCIISQNIPEYFN